MESTEDIRSLISFKDYSFEDFCVVKEFLLHSISELLPRLINNAYDAGYTFEQNATINFSLKY